MLRPMPTLALLGLLCSAADARVHWGSPGHYRLRLAHTGEVPGAPDGRHLIASHRLRIEPEVEIDALTITTQLDVLTGQIAGETTTLGDRLGERRHPDPTRSNDGWTTVEPRLIALHLDLDWMAAQGGHMAAHRGLGMVDNDGSERAYPDGLDRFGDRINGDIVDRIAVQFRPGWRSLDKAWRGLAVGGGIESVFQDDRISSLDGDDGWRGFVTLDWVGEGLEGGIRGLYRDQTDREGRADEDWHLDAWARGAIPLHTWRATLHLAGEVAIIDDGALGVLTRTALAWKRLSLGLDAGYASGGANPFSFDPDTRVGLVLFDEILRQQTMTIAEADPDAVAPDPRPTDGAVRDAIFLHPLLTWRLPRWRFGAGSLAVWRADGEWMGLESDIAAHRVFGLGAFGLQAGMFMPGVPVRQGGRGGPITRVVGRFDLFW